MASRVLAALAGGLLALGVLLLAVPDEAVAEQRLINGGFENGTSDWNGAGISASGCTPSSGARALNLSSSPSQPLALAQQLVNGIGQAPHTLTGFVKVTAGSPTVTVAMVWRNASGDLRTNSQGLAPGGSYVPFSLIDNNPPSTASSVLVKITIQSPAAATVCFDDLVLNAPLPPTPTPPPTFTSTATATFTPVVVATAIVLTPTHTPTQIAASSTPTASPIPNVATPTPLLGIPLLPPNTSTGPGFEVVNGGFEDGLRGWWSFGGDFQAVSGSGRGGSRAGIFSSSTASTKWAYQIVAVDPARAYEFSGYLRPVGVRQAYLRISWYEFADGSGRAISTDDSAVKLSGGSDSFMFLTTGGIAPPANARSARLRVMLTPDASGNASVYLDDFVFAPAIATKAASRTSDPDEPIELAAAPATATPRAADASSTATPPPSSSANNEQPVTPQASRTSRPSTEGTNPTPGRATSTPVLAADVAGARALPPATEKIDVTPRGLGNVDMHAKDGPDKDMLFVLSGIALLAGLSGAYISSKRGP